MQKLSIIAATILLTFSFTTIFAQSKQNSQAEITALRKQIVKYKSI